MDNKQKELIQVEIENCRNNIEFYKIEISSMEQKMQELERIREEYDYY
ncbi:MAG: hypothetical protein ABIB71_09480 [Candidatus Woesearchaeota archaeon]